MQLWNDYEGQTVADSYPLEKLLSPEGRSAFFLTHNGTGTPAVIRLIEPHYDDAEILERWRQVSELQEPHLIAMRKYGQTELDGTSVLYAVLEPSDDNLAEVLKHRALSPVEAREIATSLVSALEALHAHNLVHEHIEPAHVLAVGETIKLRSDCIREIPNNPEAPGEAVALRARDVHDLALTLLQALTLRHTLPGTALPAPFDAIIRNGISGAWSLAQISAALTPPSLATRPAAPTAAVAAPKPQTAANNTRLGISQTAPRTQNPAGTLSEATSQVAAPHVVAPQAVAPQVKDRLIRPVVELQPQRRGLWIGGGVAALLLVLFVWHRTGSTPVAAPTTSAPPTQSSSVPANASEAAAARPIKPSAGRQTSGTASPSTRPAVTAAANTSGHTQWRVVAFTYNREDQAQNKAASLAERFASFHPAVFSPTGRAPYLVTLGAPMERDQALALRDKARSAGLPRDTYTQNYSR